MNPMGYKLEEMYRQERDEERYHLQQQSNQVSADIRSFSPTQSCVPFVSDGSRYGWKYQSGHPHQTSGTITVDLNESEVVVSTTARKHIYPSAVSVIHLDEEGKNIEKKTMDSFSVVELKNIIKRVDHVELRKNGVPNFYWK